MLKSFTTGSRALVRSISATTVVSELLKVNFSSQLLFEVNSRAQTSQHSKINCGIARFFTGTILIIARNYGHCEVVQPQIRGREPPGPRNRQGSGAFCYNTGS